MICFHCRRRVNSDYYMLTELVWHAALTGSGPSAPKPQRWSRPSEGNGVFLHLVCVEARLGRNLVRDDFTNAPVNDMFPSMREHLAARRQFDADWRLVPAKEGLEDL